MFLKFYCLVSQWLHSDNFGQLFCITLPHGRVSSQHRGSCISLCPDLPLNVVGVSPEPCHVLAAPLLVQIWHFRWVFVVHRWAGAGCDSNRQGKGCEEEGSAPSEQFAAPGAQRWGMALLGTRCWNQGQWSLLAKLQQNLFPLSAGQWEDP